MNKYLYVLPTIFFSLNAFGSASSLGDDRDASRRALTARPATTSAVAPRELTPNEELIYAVKGYKEGYVALATLVNPLLGLVAAAHQPRESDDDLVDIRKALTKGADINCRDMDTWTPLMHAAYGGYPKIAAFLLQNGARKDLDITTRGGILSWKGYTAPSIAAHYLKKYQDLRRVCTPDMNEFYDQKITKYQALVTLFTS